MKLSFGTAVVGLVMLYGAGLCAQTPAPPRTATPARQAAPPAPPAPTPPAANPPPPAVDPSAGGQTVNIRLEVSISDQAGPQPPQAKLLTLLLADRSLNSVRSAFEDRSIGIDARPTILEGKIKLTLAIDSRRTGNTTGNTLNWNQNMTVIVESGKPVVVVENSDPANNRKLSIEVKATIIK
jgi:hypothetical protein